MSLMWNHLPENIQSFYTNFALPYILVQTTYSKWFKIYHVDFVCIFLEQPVNDCIVHMSLKRSHPETSSLQICIPFYFVNVTNGNTNLQTFNHKINITYDTVIISAHRCLKRPVSWCQQQHVVHHLEADPSQLLDHAHETVHLSSSPTARHHFQEIFHDLLVQLIFFEHESEFWLFETPL